MYQNSIFINANFVFNVKLIISQKIYLLINILKMYFLLPREGGGTNHNGLVKKRNEMWTTVLCLVI